MLMKRMSRFRLGDKLDKKVVQAVLERSGGLCEVCSSAYLVELHHIIYGSWKRRQHENEHSVIAGRKIVLRRNEKCKNLEMN